MTQFRFIPLAVALASASVMIACSTAPPMTMGTAGSAPVSMAATDHMAKMEAQMKSMRDMHEKMMSAKTSDDRNKLMPEHMKSTQDGMDMMGAMGDMKGMQGMSGEVGARHQMMEKRMEEMMQAMMIMMMDQMLAAPAK
jgi:hypothetical protein